MRISSNFLKRSVTALALLGTAAVAINYLNQQQFFWINTAFFLCLGWEFAFLSGWSRLNTRVYYLLLLIIGFQLSTYVPLEHVVKGATFMGALLILNFFVTLVYGNQPIYSFEWISLIGILNLSTTWYVFLRLKHSPSLLWLGLIIVGLTDTLAYVVGGRWGRHHLAINVSPGKTWEGCIAAILGPSLIVKISYLSNIISFGGSAAAMALVTLTSLAVVAGDLFESALKRQNGVKDSGKALPGHGGWLDRFDGLIGAMPVFFVGLFYLTVL